MLLGISPELIFFMVWGARVPFRADLAESVPKWMVPITRTGWEGRDRDRPGTFGRKVQAGGHLNRVGRRTTRKNAN